MADKLRETEVAYNEAYNNDQELDMLKAFRKLAKPDQVTIINLAIGLSRQTYPDD